MQPSRLEVARELLKEHAATAAEAPLLDGFQAALDAFAEAAENRINDPHIVQTAAEAMEAMFAYTGNFATLDGAIEMRRRLQRLETRGADEHWRIRNTHYPLVERRVSEEKWTMHHANGLVSYILEKDWSGWDGFDWPMDHTVQTPDGSTITFKEGHFGDGWQVVSTQEAEDIVAALPRSQHG